MALRATSSADGALLVRAKAGEAVVIQKSANGNQIVRGRWLRVLHFPGTVAPAKTDPGYKRGKFGWMHKSYVDECG